MMSAHTVTEHFSSSAENPNWTLVVIGRSPTTNSNRFHISFLLILFLLFYTRFLLFSILFLLFMHIFIIKYPLYFRCCVRMGIITFL